MWTRKGDGCHANGLLTALIIGAPAAFWTAIGKTAADFPNLTWEHFLVNNLLPVTLGNIVGGALLVGAVYWFVYLRPAASEGMGASR